jgi:hypothetical protein
VPPGERLKISGTAATTQDPEHGHQQQEPPALRRVVILQLIPRNELSQLDSAIVTGEFAAKRQEEVFERELMTMLTPVHVENSGPLLGSDQPVHAGPPKSVSW